MAGARKGRNQLKWTVSWTNPASPTNWGLTCQLAARCHHCQELGRGRECPVQPVPKVTTKVVHGEVEAHGQREGRGGRGELIEFSQAKPGAGSAGVK